MLRQEGSIGFEPEVFGRCGSPLFDLRIDEGGVGSAFEGRLSWRRTRVKPWVRQRAAVRDWNPRLSPWPKDVGGEGANRTLLSRVDRLTAVLKTEIRASEYPVEPSR